MLALAARNGELDLRNQFLLRFITNFLRLRRASESSALSTGGIISSQINPILIDRVYTERRSTAYVLGEWSSESKRGGERKRWRMLRE